MYRSTFSADWDRLEREAAIERAFALGVAAACGEEHDEEFRRIRDASSSAYDRSIVDLAFEQGWARASNLVKSGTNPAAVWEELIESETDEPRTDQHLPGALGRIGALERAGLEGPPRSLDRPDFLTRR